MGEKQLLGQSIYLCLVEMADPNWNLLTLNLDFVLVPFPSLSQLWHMWSSQTSHTTVPYSTFSIFAFFQENLSERERRKEAQKLSLQLWL